MNWPGYRIFFLTYTSDDIRLNLSDIVRRFIVKLWMKRDGGKMDKLGSRWKPVLARIAADIKNYYIGIIFFAVYSVVVRTIFHAFCPFLIAFGFPCAGCGMTRAIWYILTGSFRRGMNLNPAAPLWILFLAYFFWERYIIGRNKKRVRWCLAVVCVVTFFIYIYRMLHDFPGSPPLVYYRNNLVVRILRQIQVHSPGVN